MSRSFRQTQAGLHTWSGLLVGWVLFVVFVAGSAACWREPLNRWAQPELPRIEDPTRVVRGMQSYLTLEAPDAATWFITVPTKRSAGGTVFWVPGPSAQHRPGKTSAMIDADGRAVTARETRGGDFFYRFHFDLYYLPYLWSRWIVGTCAMFMLVAILTGIVTHKKIFRDFFTFRGGKGQRSWLDGHNALGVLALPFHLMITYTGLVTLMAMLMPWAVVANYNDPGKISAIIFPQPPAVERTGRQAPTVDLEGVLRDAERRLGAPVDFVTVTMPGDASARITISQSNQSRLSNYTPKLTYDGVSGRLLWASPPPGAAAVTAGTMIGLHAGRYADITLRWVYFLCGIGGSAMVASGLVLWTVKRSAKPANPARSYFGFQLVERLNVGVIAGFPAAIVCFLWANRTLPVTMPKRADAEVNILFLCWGLLLLHAFLRAPRRAWIEQLSLSALLLLALPLYDMAATAKGLPATIAAGDWTLAGADLTLAALGLAFGLIAAAVRRYRSTTSYVRNRYMTMQ